VSERLRKPDATTPEPSTEPTLRELLEADGCEIIEADDDATLVVFVGH
jgi:hypothetical protein